MHHPVLADRHVAEERAATQESDPVLAIEAVVTGVVHERRDIEQRRGLFIQIGAQRVPIHDPFKRFAGMGADGPDDHRRAVGEE